MVVKDKFYKIFLICSNVLLLCTGLTVLILGIKLLLALSVLALISVPLLQNAVNSLIATGVFITLCSLAGLLGACNESKGLVVGHLIFLGVIVILEFSIGVTLMTVRKTVSEAMDSSECNNVCSATFDAAILDYALPSAGLMMSVIFVEAMMIYSSIRLYFFLRDRPSMTVVTGPSIIVQNVQMQNVVGNQTTYFSSPQNVYSSPMEYTPRESQISNRYQATSFRRFQADIEDKPPDYNSLSHFPPPYSNEMLQTRTSASAEHPAETEENFNQV